MIQTGQMVRTPDGKTGRLAAPSTGGRPTYKFSETDLNNTAYTVFMDDGEVRHFIYSALTPVED